MATKELDLVQPFETVPWQFLDELIAFYCDKPEPDILDPTCNKRRMWGKSEHLKSKKFVAMDINPEVKPDIVSDNTNTPFAANSFDVIAYDPPHTGDQRKSKTEFAAKYGIGVSTKNPETGKWETSSTPIGRSSRKRGASCGLRVFCSSSSRT